MHTKLSISKLPLIFSWKLFLLLVVLVSVYMGMKKYEFTHSYNCTMTVYAPTSTLLQGASNLKVLSEITQLTGAKIVNIGSVNQFKPQIFTLSSTSSNSDTVCESIDRIEVYLNELNARAELAVIDMQDEAKVLSGLLAYAFETGTSDSFNFETSPELKNEEGWLRDAVSRKILLGRLINNPSALKFSIQDKRIESNGQKAYFSVSARLKTYILTIAMSAAVALLVGYFCRLLFNIREH